MPNFDPLVLVGLGVGKGEGLGIGVGLILGNQVAISTRGVIIWHNMVRLMVEIAFRGSEYWQHVRKSEGTLHIKI